MTNQEATIKAVKLLRLAQSANEHEAALAMSRAQELIDRHKLTNLSLDMDTENPEEDILNFPQDPLESNYASWKGRLAMGLSRNNQCKVYTSSGKIIIIGRPSDATAVRYLYAWMIREIARIAEKTCAGCGRVFWNNFRTGMVETVVRRLDEQRKATFAAVQREAVEPGSGTMELMQVNTAIAKMDARLASVEAWSKKAKVAKSHPPHPKRHECPSPGA